MPRKPSAEEIAQVGRDEGHPDRYETALKLNAFRHEIDGEPIRNEKPYGVSKGSGYDGSPSLGQFQKIEPPELRARR